MSRAAAPAGPHALPAPPRPPCLGVGLMSGTSADGIDAAAVEIEEREGELRVALRAFETFPYPPAVRERLFRCFESAVFVREVCLLHGLLGDLFADAAERIAVRLGADRARLAFAASHGQTVWHEPPARGQPGSTLQLGEAARIAERLGIPVVSDFRQQDIALGGQGAPLVPYVDRILFADAHENRAVQNLGGIGNVTYLPAGSSSAGAAAFDTGPGNALIDAAAGLVSAGGLEYDRDGALASQAPPDPELLARLLADPYFSQPPPKSTGRERFGGALVRGLWEEGRRGPALVSTLTQLTVESIASAYRRWLGPVESVILGGGGARNPELVRRLAAALAPARVLRHEDFGLDGDAKEAIAFALLGFETLRGNATSLPAVTGASRPAVQGKVSYP